MGPMSPSWPPSVEALPMLFPAVSAGEAALHNLPNSVDPDH